MCQHQPSHRLKTRVIICMQSHETLSVVRADEFHVSIHLQYHRPRTANVVPTIDGFCEQTPNAGITYTLIRHIAAFSYIRQTLQIAISHRPDAVAVSMNSPKKSKHRFMAPESGSSRQRRRKHRVHTSNTLLCRFCNHVSMRHATAFIRSGAPRGGGGGGGAWRE